MNAARQPAESNKWLGALRWVRPQAEKATKSEQCISASDGPVNFAGGGLDLVFGTGVGIGFYKFSIPSTGAKGWVASGGWLGGLGGAVGFSGGRVNNAGNFVGNGWRVDFSTGIPAVGGDVFMNDKGDITGGGASIAGGGGLYGGRTSTKILSSNIPFCSN